MYVVDVIREAAAETGRVARGETSTHRHLRDRVVVIVAVTVVLDLLLATLTLLFEQHAKGTAVTSFGGAIFWTSSQLLTVSSSLPNPISTPARILDVLMEIYAITVVASLTGALGSFMIRRAHERDRAAEQAHTLPEV